MPSQQLNSEMETRVALRTAQLQKANEELSDTLGKLKLAMDQLVQSEKLASLGALVTGLAHELNTPLGNSVTIASALAHRVDQLEKAATAGLRRSALTDFLADARFASATLIRCLERANALISTFKQVAVDQNSAQRRSFNLKELVSELVLALHPTLRTRGCGIQIDIAPEVMLTSYPGALGQVFSILIDNALTHGFAERGFGQICVSAGVEREHLSITVTDDGVGIPREHLSHVFDPFFTTKLGSGGCGLGLYIAHNLVQGVLCGTIQAHSGACGGATFALRLPPNPPSLPRTAHRPISEFAQRMP
jgi:C4-dicarboxylate-specific signal transduction histidine kinase